MATRDPSEEGTMVAEKTITNIDGDEPWGILSPRSLADRLCQWLT